MISKQMGSFSRGRVVRMSMAAAAALGLASAAGMVQAQDAQQSFPAPGGQFSSAPQLQLTPAPAPTAITPDGSVVENVIARVNDQIITRSEYERAEQGLLQSAQQQGATQAQLDEQEHNLLRDMIDQQLLLSKGKELGITGDAETMRELDDLRKENHLDSMEALQKAAETQGVSFEDFKQQIQNRAITQEVVRDEVGRRISMTHTQEQAYYDAHKQEFAVPEQVHLSEILITTPDNATDAQIAAAQAKADAAAAKLKAGANFADLAKQVSGGPTASVGGDLGDFKRGALGDVLENATFPLPVGGVTAPIRTRQGFVILRVDSHQQAGVPPLSQVEPQVQEAIYMQQMQPALRAYLSKARDEAYIDIAPGYVDTGSNRKETKPVFTAYAAPKPKKKAVQKERMEQEKQQRAEAALAAARERLREQQEAKNADVERKAGMQDVNAPAKRHKIHREKIRYGQAPRMALPTAATAVAANDNPPLAGQSTADAMASNDATTTITTGVGPDADENPLAAKAVSGHKTRFADREVEAHEEHEKTKLVRVTHKVEAHPVQATPQEAADEKVQASPLGLNGDTAKKKKHGKRVKGEPKERLQEKPKADEKAAPQPVAPTVNPALTGAPAQTTSTAPTQNTGATQQ